MPVTTARAGRKPVAEGATDGGDPLAGRLGLSVPREWWPSPPLLKSYEAAGFSWVQLHSPPPSVLRDAALRRRHAAAADAVLETTGLEAVIHAPSGLRAGDADSDRALEGLLAYSAEVGAAQVVYHALELPDASESEATLAAEERSLDALASLAERLEVTIAIENVCPLFPGPEALSANPFSLRGLAQRIGSERLGLCLDIGHAHVIADQRRTFLELLIEPVMDLVSVFHLHDNLGARWQPTGRESGIDPLRLDLHLPPGRGTLPWERVRESVARHSAPLLLEVHPPHRPRASALVSDARRLLAV